MERQQKSEGGDAGGVVAGWWLEAMAAGVLTPVQVEAAWLSLGLFGAQEGAAAAARLVREYHRQAGATGQQRQEKGGAPYHCLHFARLRALVLSRQGMGLRLDE
jgi:hypothetical protein